MTDFPSLNIGGVPEHFNLPWQQAIRWDVFAHNRIDIRWTFFAGGTGAMTKALSFGELDVAILLTEGFLSAVSQGLKAKIVKTYIDTPLLWGIYSGVNNTTQNVSEKGKYAISRKGSGSHLMAAIHAAQLLKPTNEDDLVIVDSLEGAIRSLNAGETDFFYWEMFMTNPYVQRGQIKKIGEFSAPWSSFLIVASEKALETKSNYIQLVLDTMLEQCQRFKSNPQSVFELTNRFSMTRPEAETWLGRTQWNQGYSVNMSELEKAKNELSKIGMCNPQLDLDQTIAPWLNSM